MDQNTKQQGSENVVAFAEAAERLADEREKLAAEQMKAQLNLADVQLRHGIAMMNAMTNAEARARRRHRSNLIFAHANRTPLSRTKYALLLKLR